MTTGRINQVALIRGRRKMQIIRSVHPTNVIRLNGKFECSKVTDPHTRVAFRIREIKQALEDRNDTINNEGHVRDTRTATRSPLQPLQPQRRKEATK